MMDRKKSEVRLSGLVLLVAMLAGGGTILIAGCNKPAEDATPSVSTAPAALPAGAKLKKPDKEKMTEVAPTMNPGYHNSLGSKATK